MQEIKNFTDYKLSLKERILNEAMKDFAKHGVKAVKMDDIAASLSISKRTLYELFDTKEQVIYECIKHYHEQATDEMNAFAQDPKHDVLDVIIYLYSKHIKESERMSPSFYDEITKYPRVVEYIEQHKIRKQQNFIRFMHRGVEEGYFRQDINYDIIAHVFEALGSYMHQTHLYQLYSFEDLFFNMLFVTFRGFCTPKGISKLDQFFVVKSQ